MKLSLIRHITIFISTWFIFINNIQAEEVRIFGYAKDYAGLHIEVESYVDFITHRKQLVTVIHVDDEGHFDCHFDLEQTTYAFLEIGAYKAYIFLEPGKQYEAIFPPFTPRPDADRFNPFFEHENIELGIANDVGNLNESIRNFDQFFNKVYNEYVIWMVRTHNKKKAEVLINQCDSVAKAQNCNNEFFDKYVKYREAQIYVTPRINASKSALRDKFIGNNVEYNIPSYWDALDLVAHNFLSSYQQTKNGRNIDKESRIFGDIDKVIANDSLYKNNTSLREVLILKGIYDDFYSDLLSEGQTDTLFITATNQLTDERNIEIAFSMLAKKNHMKVGSEAPDFSLLDINNKEVSLSDFRKKFVYLAFLHTQNFSCIKDIPALSSVAKKYRRDMVVVGIMTDEDTEHLPGFFNKRKCTWTVLSFNAMQNVIFDYGVESLPAYFLIDPEGCIASSSAPAPTENIEIVVANQIKSYKAEQQKKNPQKQRDIYDIVKYGH